MSDERIRTDISVSAQKGIPQLTDQIGEMEGIPVNPLSNRAMVEQILVRLREIENALVKAGVLPSRSQPDTHP